MLILPAEQISEYVHVPRGFTRDYLQETLSGALEGDATIVRCTATNLCASKSMRVSDSGATVLRLALDLIDGRSIDLVLKVLSPDSVNIFKIDRRFEARSWEAALMRWWGSQGIPQLPVVYDTRSEQLAREYWILYEYFPHVGWAENGQSSDTAVLVRLVEHVASLHAYSRSRIEELRAIQPGADCAPGGPCSPAALVRAIDAALADAEFLTDVVGLSDDEQGVLSDCLRTIAGRPSWVDEWDSVCVNRDFSVANTAVRDTNEGPQLVSFDWSAAHIGPIEQDFEVLLGRDFKVDKATQDMLVRRYLDAYTEFTGHRIAFDLFMARIPWARLTAVLGYAIEHLDSLKWMQWQNRSVHFIHLFIRLARSIAAEIESKEWADETPHGTPNQMGSERG